MSKKEHLRILMLKAVKTLVILFTLAAISWFIGVLPFAADLSFMSPKLPVTVFFSALLSMMAIVVFVLFGSEIAPSVDALLDFIPGAGALAGNLVKIIAALFAYDALQPPVFPFIRGYEWLYQSLFLGLTLFFLFRAGLLVYAASESIGGFILNVFNPYGRPEASKSEPPEA